MNNLSKLPTLLLTLSLIILLTGLQPAPSYAQEAQAFVVNTLDDRDDGACDDTHCSLREAISAANRNIALDAIQFNLPGLGPYTIRPLAPLPVIADPVLIDGWTQPGFSDLPVIEIDGSGIEAPGVTGLLISGGRSAIRGLQIKRFSGYGLILTANGGDVIQGNVVGGNGEGGILIDNVPDNRIGGEDPATGNLIAANSGPGIWIRDPDAFGNVVRGNVIGSDPTGGLPVGNTGAGIALTSAPANTIGPDNVIDTNTGPGISITDSGAVNNVVTGNLIGPDQGNSGAGIIGGSGASNNVFGPNNIITNNSVGVLLLAPSTGNAVTANTIFGNTQGGIDLDPPGPTLNDPLDADGGTNRQQNYPQLLRLSNPTQVEGLLDSTPLTAFQVEVYHSTVCDSAGFGQGETLVATVTVNTAEDGQAAFSAALDSQPQGGVLTALAIETATGNTSEFSACLALPAVPTAQPTEAPAQEASPAPTSEPTSGIVESTPAPSEVAEEAGSDLTAEPQLEEPDDAVEAAPAEEESQSREMTWLFVGIASIIMMLLIALGSLWSGLQDGQTLNQVRREAEEAARREQGQEEWGPETGAESEPDWDNEVEEEDITTSD